MRGNPRVCGGTMPASWSIPAYAGEPGLLAVSTAWRGVYPRVCGGTWTGVSSPKIGQGLSPRMRGNRAHGLHQGGEPRSIPAYAGEPLGCSLPAASTTVYPRVCGGTDFTHTLGMSEVGLSPRMRGNPTPRRHPRRRRRSIPAYAGEPSTDSRATRTSAVYPRVCGGTQFYARRVL